MASRRRIPVSTRVSPEIPGGGRRAAKKAYPSHAERLKDIVLEEAYRMIGVRDGGREVKVPMAQAVIRALAVNAVKGHQRAQRLFTELLSDHRARRMKCEAVRPRARVGGLPSALSRRIRARIRTISGSTSAPATMKSPAH